MCQTAAPRRCLSSCSRTWPRWAQLKVEREQLRQRFTHVMALLDDQSGMDVTRDDGSPDATTALRQRFEQQLAACDGREKVLEHAIAEAAKQMARGSQAASRRNSQAASRASSRPAMQPPTPRQPQPEEAQSPAEPLPPPSLPSSLSRRASSVARRVSFSPQIQTSEGLLEKLPEFSPAENPISPPRASEEMSPPSAVAPELALPSHAPLAFPPLNGLLDDPTFELNLPPSLHRSWAEMKVHVTRSLQERDAIIAEAVKQRTDEVEEELLKHYQSLVESAGEAQSVAVDQRIRIAELQNQVDSLSARLEDSEMERQQMQSASNQPQSPRSAWPSDLPSPRSSQTLLSSLRADLAQRDAELRQARTQEHELQNTIVANLASQNELQQRVADQQKEIEQLREAAASRSHQQQHQQQQQPISPPAHSHGESAWSHERAVWADRLASESRSTAHLHVRLESAQSHIRELEALLQSEQNRSNDAALQAEQARRERQLLEEELTRFDAHTHGREQQLHSQVQQLQRQVDTQQQELQEANASLQRLQQLSESHSAQEAELQSLRRKLARTREARSLFEQSIEGIEMQLQASQREVARLGAARVEDERQAQAQLLALQKSMAKKYAQQAPAAATYEREEPKVYAPLRVASPVRLTATASYRSTSASPPRRFESAYDAPSAPAATIPIPAPATWTPSGFAAAAGPSPRRRCMQQAHLHNPCPCPCAP